MKAEQIEECEALLGMADHAIHQQALTIDMLTQQNYRLEKNLDFTMKQVEQKAAWYRQPEYIAPITFIVGVALGAYVTGAAR